MSTSSQVLDLPIETKKASEASLPEADATGTAEFVSISIFDALGRINSQQDPLYLGFVPNVALL